LEEARKTTNYKRDNTYWLYQIIQELNTYLYNSKSYTKDELKNLELTTSEKKWVSVEYIDLNTKIDYLKKFLKDYYKNQIQNKLFEYELLK
jgi:dipeptidase